MFDAFTKLIAQADARAAMVADSNKRMDSVTRITGASVAEGVRKMKDAALSIANDRNGITPGDCSALMSEIGTYFDRAAAAVG